MQELDVLNESDLRDAKARLAKLEEAGSANWNLQQIRLGVPAEVVAQVQEALVSELKRLREAVSAFERAKEEGDAAPLLQRTGGHPGLALIVGRIAKGYTQRELAWRLGVKEQQVQRYEADKYNSISLRNYLRIASVLGVRLAADVQAIHEFRGLDQVIENVSRDDIRKILRHGRSHGWFEEDVDEAGLQKQIAESRILNGSPSLLRTGLNVHDFSGDALLYAWRSRVALRARNLATEKLGKFDTSDVSWLIELVRLSVLDDGPRRAIELLRERGIIVIVEPQIPSLNVDGAAFIEEGVPVVGLTLRRDAVDSFWFTLLHEVGHVILHFRTGLSSGFYDEEDAKSQDQQELEANRFASNLLIPEERWKKSVARIAKKPEVIESFSREIGVHPAVVFGRIRKERNDYKIFSDKIGTGSVRKQLYFITEEK